MSNDAYLRDIISLKLLVAIFAIVICVFGNRSIMAAPVESVIAGLLPPVTDASKLATPVNSKQTQVSFKTVSEKRPTQAPKEVMITSLDELTAFFDSLGYSDSAWSEGNHEVPRVTIAAVSKEWQKKSSTLPVQRKKMVFFRFMMPMILMANERILLERRIIAEAELGAPELKALAHKYHLINHDTDDFAVTEQHRQLLLHKVDILPPSLMLAQAADESGWATSHFTLEGNAFFGQWDFSHKGMHPKEQRKALGDYGIARFDSPLASVEAYLHNLNTNGAYKSLRQLRASLRVSNKSITGMHLAETLLSYSERGQAYVDDIRQMISYNRLEKLDGAYLSDREPLHLIWKDSLPK